MRVRWSKEARGDVVNIRRTISERNPAAAPKIAARILEVIKHLQTHPEMGRKGLVPNTYELVVTSTPYLVIYEVLLDHVHILGVEHGARDRTPEPDD